MVKRRVKPGRIARQRIAIAPQQPHAERVEGARRRAPNPSGTSSSSDGYALAHLAGGFVGERDGQDGGRRHVPRGDQVRDAVRDDAGLAAARAGQDQQRTFGAATASRCCGLRPWRKSIERGTLNYRKHLLSLL